MSEHYLRDDIAAQLGSQSLLSWAQKLADAASPADIYRSKEGRKTLRFIADGRPYFLKLHLGIGWREVLKNILKLRMPVTGARNEYDAVCRLTRIGVPTLSVAAYSVEGRNPARQRSLLVTDELTGTISLEDFCEHWASNPPSFAVRSKLIRVVADSARRMHGAGINHRDFYLCHFHLAEETLSGETPRCHIIDLHRAQLRDRTPRRWRVKDLAGLYFSAIDSGLRRRDILRFLRDYCDGDLRTALTKDKRFWQQVEQRARALYLRERGAEAPVL
ncbi:MAG: lipopolysaccharide core heptose(I) kinase RfaP [Halieaceae bacterium]